MALGINERDVTPTYGKSERTLAASNKGESNEGFWSL